MELKINDKLYCHNNILDNDMRIKYSSTKRNLTINHTYIIHSIEPAFSGNGFFILNDMNNQDWYSFDDINEWYYKKWFYNKNEYRKLKWS